MVPASGGEAVQVTEKRADLLEENHFAPAWLPDNRHFLMLVRGGAELGYKVWLGELGSNSRTLLLSDATNAQYVPPAVGNTGHLVFARGMRLMAQPFDIGRMSLTGDPVTLAESVAGTAVGGVSDFSVSANGALAYRTSELAQQELVWYDRAGNQVERIETVPAARKRA